MVKYMLKISAEVDNIKEVSTSGPDFEWHLQLKCNECQETDSGWHVICVNEEVKSKHGPGVFNFQMKCKCCSNIFTVDIVKGSMKPLKVSSNGIIDKQPAVTFDCRGVEPVAFDPEGNWVVKAEEGDAVIADVEFPFEEPFWVGYDEKKKLPLGIDNFKGVFERIH